MLDLYQGRFEGKLLEPGRLRDLRRRQAARSRRAGASIASAPPAPGRGQRVEHEYERMGAVTCLDAWDVRRGQIMGRTEPRAGSQRSTGSSGRS